MKSSMFLVKIPLFASFQTKLEWAEQFQSNY